MTPIRTAEGEKALTSYLRALDRNESPLSQVACVHFGRWVVIDRLKTDWPGAPTHVPVLQSPYLLFTASVTGPGTTSFLTELVARIPHEVDAIWGHCVNYPAAGTVDVKAVVAYLSRGLIETSLFYVGYPDVTPEEVNAALVGHAKLKAFVIEHQVDQDSAALHAAYLREAPTWFR